MTEQPGPSFRIESDSMGEIGVPAEGAVLRVALTEVIVR